VEKKEKSQKKIQRRDFQFDSIVEKKEKVKRKIGAGNFCLTQ